MTTPELLERVRRAWVVLLVGAVLTTVACLGVHQHRGVYWSRVSLYLLSPTNAVEKNPLRFTTASVIATAGLVAHEVTPVEDYPSTVTDTTLVAEGVTEGERVRVPNSGGQWALNFNRPVLDVEVVSHDREWVGQRIGEIVTLLQRTVAQMQSRDGIAADRMITTDPTPARATVQYSAGDPRRALAMTLLLGTCLTAAGAVLLPDLLRRLRRTAQRARLPRLAFPTIR